MNKVQQIKKNRLERHKARRKGKVSGDYPVKQALWEYEKQIRKSEKIKKGKLEKLENATKK
jgi:hypothetical protein